MSDHLKKIVFRVDANPVIGWGHVSRCLALADMLKDEFSLVFAMISPNEKIKERIKTKGIELIELNDGNTKGAEIFSFADVAVLDGYQFTGEDEIALQAAGLKVVTIDDLLNRKYFSDVLLNSAPWKEEVELSGRTKTFFGPAYVLIAPEFLNAAKNDRIIPKEEKLFICLGSAKTEEYSLAVLNSLLHVPQAFTSNSIWVGNYGEELKSKLHAIAHSSALNIEFEAPQNPAEMLEVMQRCSHAICSASVVSWEWSARKGGLIAIQTAENQNGILRKLEIEGMALTINCTKKGWENTFLSHFPAMNNAAQKQIQSQSRVVDGKSSERILEIFRNLI